MVLDLEVAAHLPSEQPFRRRTDGARHPEAVLVGEPENDLDLPFLGADRDEALDIADEVLRIDAEQGIADRLEDRALADAVRSAKHVDPRRELQGRVAVRLDVFQPKRNDLHGVSPPRRAGREGRRHRHRPFAPYRAAPGRDGSVPPRVRGSRCRRRSVRATPRPRCRPGSS